MTSAWQDFFDEPVAFQPEERFEDGTIKTGVMTVGPRAFPVKNGVPRFVPADDYAANFGLQWNVFSQTQLDKANNFSLSAERLWNNTHWKPEDLKGKTVLEAGSGSGRFTQVLLDAGARVVSFDLSSAVDANFQTNHGKGNLFLFQGSIYDIPVKGNFFDYVFCFGVLQHTPEPEKAYEAIYCKLKPGGALSIDYYLKTRKLVPWSLPKYFWRPLSTRMKPERLLSLIRFYVPLWLPFDTFLKKIPRIGNALATLTLIPCWNYHYLPLDKSQQREWAIMDTFDALGAAYDYPKTLDEVRAMVSRPDATDVEVFYGSNGVVANVRKMP